MNYLNNRKIRKIKKYKLNWLTLISITLGINISNINLTRAKPVTYDFTVNVVQGSLKGHSYNGFFTYDDEQLTGKERETITAKDGLKVCMNFFKQMRDETKDVDYPEFPQLTFQDGKPETLDFWVESSTRSIWWNRNGWEVETSLSQDMTSKKECLMSPEKTP